MGIHESQSAPLNPEGELLNMESARLALMDAGEIEGGSDLQLVENALEGLESARDALKELSSDFGSEVVEMLTALNHEIERLQKFSPTHRYH